MSRGFGARETSLGSAKASPLQAAYESKVGSMKSKPTAATVSKFLSDNIENPKFKKEMEDVASFVQVVNRWQSDSNATNRQEFVDKFLKLPVFIREAISDDKSALKNLWRGDDVIDGKDANEGVLDSVKAFSDSPFAAEFFGSGLYTPDDVEKVDGIISMERLGAIVNKGFVDDFNDNLADDDTEIDLVGDDEGEKVVYGIKWKKGVGTEEWARETQRERYQKLLEAKEAKDRSRPWPPSNAVGMDGRMRFIGEDGENIMPGDGKKGMLVYDPETKLRIRPPLDLILKDRLPQVFGEMTKDERATFEKLDRRGG